MIELATTERRIKLYQEGNKKFLSASMSPLFYESANDSGDFNTPINMTPVLDAGGKFYSIVANGWHFKIWVVNDGATKAGTIGYGGRQGNNWVYSYIDSIIGYDSSDQNIQFLQPDTLPPTYDINNFYTNQSALTIGVLNEQITIGSSIGWNNVWAGIDVRLKANGDGLKIEVVASDSARQVIVANAAGMNLATTNIGPRLDVDFDNATLKQNGLTKNPNTPFDDLDGEISLEDESNNLIAHLPLDIAYIENDASGQYIPVSTRRLNPLQYRQPLTKRFWQAGNNTFILAGVNADVINSMASGELVFDPTFNQTVTNANDGDDDGSSWYANGEFSNWIYLYSGHVGCFRFTVLAAGSVTQGLTFDTATIKLYRTAGTNPHAANLFGDDVDTCAAFSGSSLPSARTQTTASVAAGTTEMGSDNTQYTLSIVGIADEVIGRGSWADNLGLIWVGTGGNELAAEDSSHANSNEAILDLSWTAAAPTDVVFTRVEIERTRVVTN